MQLRYATQRSAHIALLVSNDGRLRDMSWHPAYRAFSETCVLGSRDSGSAGAIIRPLGLAWSVVCRASRHLLCALVVISGSAKRRESTIASWPHVTSKNATAAIRGACVDDVDVRGTTCSKAKLVTIGSGS